MEIVGFEFPKTPHIYWGLRLQAIRKIRYFRQYFDFAIHAFSIPVIVPFSGQDVGMPHLLCYQIPVYSVIQ